MEVEVAELHSFALSYVQIQQSNESYRLAATFCNF